MDATERRLLGSFLQHKHAQLRPSHDPDLKLIIHVPTEEHASATKLARLVGGADTLGKASRL
jgi:hypothetical protein